jgi:hypothetical protein
VLFPFLPLIALCVANVFMVRTTDANHFDIEGFLFFFLALALYTIYGLGLRNKTRRLKFLAIGLIATSLVFCGIRIAFLQSQIDFLSMDDVSRFSFYGAHLGLLLVSLLSAVWRKR